MTRKNVDGFVVAKEEMTPKQHGPRYRTLYWQGPDGRNTWGTSLPAAARFVDAKLAEHVLRTSLGDFQLRLAEGFRIEPAPSPRNGGPTGDIITVPPGAAAVPVVEAEQTTLFGG